MLKHKSALPFVAEISYKKDTFQEDKIQYCSLCSGKSKKVTSDSTYNCKVYLTSIEKR